MGRFHSGLEIGREGLDLGAASSPRSATSMGGEGIVPESDDGRPSAPPRPSKDGGLDYYSLAYRLDG